MNEFEVEIVRQFDEASKVISESKSVAPQVAKAAEVCIASLKAGGKIMICGNGGSAADSQHIAAELVNRYKRNRAPLAGIALSTDGSNLTSIGNDFSFDLVFSKQVEALGKKGDVLIGISTSGNSKNVIEAVASAKKLGVATIGLTGATGGNMNGQVDVLIAIPGPNTARVQEAQHVAYHALCDLIERECTGD